MLNNMHSACLLSKSLSYYAYTTWGLFILLKWCRLKTCWWLNNMFILRAVRNTYSVGTLRIGYSLASDQIINMQRIITKWCVVQQNCVKYIMNLYSWCLTNIFLILQHLDAKVVQALKQIISLHFVQFSMFWYWYMTAFDFVAQEIWNGSVELFYVLQVIHLKFYQSTALHFTSIRILNQRQYEK